MPPVKQIPVADIVVPEVRITAVYDEELKESLRASLTTTGQLVPIIVVETEEGYELVDGLHRLDDAKGRGAAKIEAKILKGDSVDAMLYNISTNRLRGKLKASEMVKVISHLTEERGLDSDQIAERIGATRDYIERLWKIAAAHASVREALDKELIGVGVAFELSRLPNHEQQEASMATVHTFHMTVGQAKDLVDEVIELSNMPKPEPVVRPQVVAAPPTCEVCNDVAPPNLLVAVQLDPKCYGKLSLLVAEDKRGAPPQDSEVQDTPAP